MTPWRQQFDTTTTRTLVLATMYAMGRSRRRTCRGHPLVQSATGSSLVNAQWPFLNQLERRRVISLAKVVWVRFGDSTVAEAAERRSAEETGFGVRR